MTVAWHESKQLRGDKMKNLVFFQLVCLLLGLSSGMARAESSTSDSLTNNGFRVAIVMDSTLYLEYQRIWARVDIINTSDVDRRYYPAKEYQGQLLSADGTAVARCGLLSYQLIFDYASAWRVVAAGDTAAGARRELTAEFGPGHSQFYCTGIPPGKYTFFLSGYPSDSVNFRVVEPTSDDDIQAPRLIKAAFESGSYPDNNSPWRSNDKMYATYLDSVITQFPNSNYVATALDLMLTRTYTIGLSDRERNDYALKLMKVGNPNYVLDGSRYLRPKALTTEESAWVREKLEELKK